LKGARLYYAKEVKMVKFWADSSDLTEDELTEVLKREGIDIDKVIREIEVLKREGVDIDKIIREIKEVVKERIKD